MHFPAILTSETTEKEGREPGMGAMYDEDEELDYSFLKQSVRQQPRGAAARRRTDDNGRDRMADMISGSRQRPGGATPQRRSGQGQVSGSKSGQGQIPRQAQAAQSRNGQVQVQTAQSRNRQVQAQAAQSRNRQAQVQAAQSRNRQAQVQATQSRNRQAQMQAVQGRTRQTDVSRPLTMQEKQRQAALLKRRRRLRRQKQLLAVLLCILIVGSVFAVFQLRKMGAAGGTEIVTGGETMSEMMAGRENDSASDGIIQGIPESRFNLHPQWTEDFLTVSEYSRPGDALSEVKNIFVHYTANLNTSAAQNRNYFEHLKDNHDVPGASAHFIIGIEGEILQIIPLDEMAYAVQTRNEDSISIECCYKYENGQFTQETYDSLIKLLAWLADTYELEPDDILRHYDCGGKKCPLYYVDHEDAWRILKRDVAEQMLSTQ